MNAMKLAIIGGGPSAFYVASRVLKTLPLPTYKNVSVHIFDRVWAPHGLVRYGVAPDHPEVKNCTHKFDETAQDSRFRFFGNVEVAGTKLTIPHAVPMHVRSIFDNYSHICFATGCAWPRTHDSYELDTSPITMSALSFVHWYTQHPMAPRPPPLDKVSRVSIIGNGNVALDVARMLLTDVKVLSKYDVPQRVLDVLSRSTVEHVNIVGRRGPLEAAFTTKELREMMNLSDASMVPLDPLLLTPPPSKPLTRQQSRILGLLHQGSKNEFGTTSKTWSLDFFLSAFGLFQPEGCLSAQISAIPTTLDPQTNRAVESSDTNQITNIVTDLIITSIGLQVEPWAVFNDKELGRIPNVDGRVTSVLKTNIYASGWAATGAKGVLASTMFNAYKVADEIISDWIEVYSHLGQDYASNIDEPPEEVRTALKEGLVTTYADWKKIDEEEVRRGEAIGKERERMRWSEARKFLNKQVQS